MASSPRSRKPSPWRRITREVAVLLTAGFVLSIGIAWLFAFLPPIGPRVHASMHVRIAPLHEGLEGPLPVDRAIDLSQTSTNPAYGRLPTDWVGLPEDSMLLGLHGAFIDGFGSARSSVELRYMPDYSKLHISFALTRYDDLPALSSLDSIAAALSLKEAYEMAFAPNASASVSGNIWAANAQLSIARHTASSKRPRWAGPLDSISTAQLTRADPLRYEDVRHIAEGIPAEEVAHGWPFLCLYSRTYEHRAYSMKAAGRPVSGGIRVSPRRVTHYKANQFAPGEPARDMVTTESRVFPLLPIWPGLILNTLIYAAALWLLTLGPCRLRRALRTRRGCCGHCGYDLNNLATDRCPECGKDRMAMRRLGRGSARGSGAEPPSEA